ncbi:DUF1647 domain-containing protein [Acidimicrobiia bacterium]|nr:DUF1647 domain-containing protein [Acidimicrobiia bacterium]
MISKLKNSDKIKRFLNVLSNVPKYTYDYLLICFGIFINIIKYRKPYLKQLNIVTGTDHLFYSSLLQLIENIKEYENDCNLIVYDLGLNNDQLEELRNKYSKLQIKKFNFKDYPTFISLRDEHNKLGNYAWKSIILKKELIENKDPVIWFDTGNIITKKLTYIRIVILAYGFYSPLSDGTIRKWTHQGSIHLLDVRSSILKKRNLTGGIVGANKDNSKAFALVNKWEEFCKIENYIAPKGSSRENHRQDQSLLSILKYQNKVISPKMKKNFGLMVNQNPGTKIYLSDSQFSDKRLIKSKWIKSNFTLTINTIKQSDIVWILDVSDISAIPKKY